VTLMAVSASKIVAAFRGIENRERLSNRGNPHFKGRRNSPKVFALAEGAVSGSEAKGLKIEAGARGGLELSEAE